MAVKIDLPKDLVKNCFTVKLASLRRAHKEATNPLIKQALDDELSQITKAIDTMAEIK